MTRLRVLVARCGNMGTSHARAYHRLRDDLEMVGLVSRGPESRERLAKELGGLRTSLHPFTIFAHSVSSCPTAAELAKERATARSSFVRGDGVRACTRQ